MGVPNSVPILCKTLHQTELQAHVLSVCRIIFSKKFVNSKYVIGVDLLHTQQ